MQKQVLSHHIADSIKTALYNNLHPPRLTQHLTFGKMAYAVGVHEVYLRAATFTCEKDIHLHALRKAFIQHCTLPTDMSADVDDHMRMCIMEGRKQGHILMKRVVDSFIPV